MTFDLTLSASRDADFVLNPRVRRMRILIGGENFGCGSSREHAVWGLLQYGILAIAAQASERFSIRMP